MRPIATLLAAAAATAALTGCGSTSVSRNTSSPELLELTSIPAGVNVEVPGYGTVRTPASINLDPDQTHELRFYLHGHEDRTITVEPALAEWTNHATGRRHSLEPAFIHLDMESGERLMTGSELAAWANSESESALSESRQTIKTVAQLVQKERNSFNQAERAKIAALRALERVDAIQARDAARAARQDASEARKRAQALLDEQQGITVFALEELTAAENALKAAEEREAAALRIAKLAANIRKQAERLERKLQVTRGKYPTESLQDELASAMPDYPTGIAEEAASGFADVDPDAQQ